MQKDFSRSIKVLPCFKNKQNTLEYAKSHKQTE